MYKRQLPDGRRTQRSTGTANRKKALAIALEYDKAARTGRQGLLTDQKAREAIASIYAIANADLLPTSTVGEYLDRWLKVKTIETKDSTVAEYSKTAERLKKILGPKVNRPMDAVTVNDALRFRDGLADILAPATANKYLKIASVIWNDAGRESMAGDNPFAKVKILDTQGSTRRGFTLDQVKAIYNLASPSWRGMILLGFYCGQRLADLARLTGLTAQTIGLITTRLEDDDLLIRHERVRGRIVQPSVPLALNPDGAFAIGIKIGRRSTDWLLVDFTGHVRQRKTLSYAFPDADVLGGGASAPFSAGLRSPGGLDGALVMAGARAHTRWLAELCSESPERRCGVATVPILHDIPAALVDELPIMESLRERLARSLDAEGRVREMPVEGITDVVGNLLYGTIFSNYFSGANGWFRVAYDNKTGQCREGTRPFGMTVSFPTGGYITCARYNPTIGLLGQMLYELTSSDDGKANPFIIKYYPCLRKSVPAQKINLARFMFLPSLVGIPNACNKAPKKPF